MQVLASPRAGSRSAATGPDGQPRTSKRLRGGEGGGGGGVGAVSGVELRSFIGFLGKRGWEYKSSGRLLEFWDCRNLLEFGEGGLGFTGGWSSPKP